MLVKEGQFLKLKIVITLDRRLIYMYAQGMRSQLSVMLRT